MRYLLDPAKRQKSFVTVTFKPLLFDVGLAQGCAANLNGLQLEARGPQELSNREPGERGQPLTIHRGPGPSPRADSLYGAGGKWHFEVATSVGPTSNGRSTVTEGT